jgi:serine protease
MQTSVLPRKWTSLAAHSVLLAFVGFLLMACGGGSGGGSSGVAGNRADTGTFTVSGEITFAANTAIDSDVNDPVAPYASNDLYDPDNGLPNLVQRISRLVTLGGYVNQPGQGADGRSFAAGDESDYFVADLTTGQEITLYTAESGSNLDLFLYIDQDFDHPVAFSNSAPGEVEHIRVADAGTYFIEVKAVNGASNYTLNLTAAAGETQTASFNGGGDFVPGDVIVKFKDVGVTASSAGMVSAEMAPIGLTLKAGEPTMAMLFGMTGSNSKAQASSHLAPAIGGNLIPVLDFDLRRKLETLSVVEELKSRADVVYAEPNYIRRQQRTPSDFYFNEQWNYSMINLPQAWDTSTGDPGVIVAVIDTGIIIDHPDLHNQLTNTGYDFISDPESSMDDDGIDPDPFDDAGVKNPESSIFHGSHVAGTIAAQTNNGLGVAGVGWSTRIMPVRALGKGGIGANYDIMQAVRYAAGLANDSMTVPPQKADIINLSLSGPDESFLEQEIYDDVRAEGIVIVAAAGNHLPNQPMPSIVYPAGYDGVLAVSGVDRNEQLANYSNFGSYVDLAAPGGDLSVYGDGVLSTAAEVDSEGLTYSYSYLQGTSMAAAHMSGVIALMRAINPALTPDDLDRLLADGSITREKGVAGRDDYYGYGLIDAQKAVLAAPPGVLTVNPKSLAFGTDLRTDSLTIGKTGLGPLTLLSVNGDAAWINIVEDPAAVPGDVPARYTIQVDRTGLTAGTYAAIITCVSDNNTVEVPVSMQVVDSAATTLTVNPESLDFGTTIDALNLTVDKTGSDLITVRQPTIDASWVGIQEITPGAGASGSLPTQYRVQVDRTGLSPGEYRAAISIASDSYSVNVPVIMNVAEEDVITTFLTAGPQSLSFGPKLSSLQLTLSKEGPGPIKFLGPYIDAPWLKIEEIEFDAGGDEDLLAQYRVTVDRIDLEPGVYQATIRFESDSRILEVPVAMQVATVTDVVNGALYVQLRDPKSFETVYIETVFSEDGIYRFNFDGVASGSYLISVGTDLDNDKLVGDGGEAYLSLAQPISLQVNQNLSGLEFGVGFNIAF